MMRIDLDAKIKDRLGEDLGSVQRAIIDPETNEVTAFVINTGGLFGHDTIIQRDEILRASADGDAIRLDLSKDQVKERPSYIPKSYAAAPPTWVPPVGFSYGVPGAFWLAAYPYTLTSPLGTTDSRQLPSSATADLQATTVGIDKGATVIDRDGEGIGVVDDIRLDPESGRLQGLILRLGGPFQTMFGGGEAIDIRAETIARVEDGLVYLSLDKDDFDRHAG